MQLSDKDLGVWFGINGTSIKTQMELDLAVISLALNYGFDELTECMVSVIQKELEEGTEHEEELEMLLIDKCDKATKFLNALAKKQGYEFRYSGEEYDTLELARFDKLQ